MDQDLELEENPNFQNEDQLEADQDDNYVLNESPKKTQKNEENSQEKDIIQQTIDNKQDYQEDEQLQQQQLQQEEEQKSQQKHKTGIPKRKKNKKNKKKSSDDMSEDTNNLQNQELDQQQQQQQQKMEKQISENQEQIQDINSDDEGEEFKQQQQKQKFIDNKKNFNMINEKIEDKPIKQQNVTKKPQEKKIKNYILKDFQEIEIVYRQELEKFKKQQTLGDGDLRYQKGNVGNFSGENLLEIQKQPKHISGVIEFFTNTSKRYVLLDKHLIYVLKKVKGNNFLVKSITKLETLYKVFVEKNTKNITLAFINDKFDHKAPPKHKKFTVKDVQVFLSLLKAEITTLGYDVIYR